MDLGFQVLTIIDQLKYIVDLYGFNENQNKLCKEEIQAVEVYKDNASKMLTEIKNAKYMLASTELDKIQVSIDGYMGILKENQRKIDSIKENNRERLQRNLRKLDKLYFEEK